MRPKRPLLILAVLLLNGLVLLPVAASSGSYSQVYLPPRPTVAALPGPGTVWPTISFTADAQQAVPGNFVSWTATVTNETKSTSRGVEVRIPVPEGVKLVKVYTSKGVVKLNANNNTVKARVGKLEPGKTVKITLQTRVMRNQDPRAYLYGFAKLVMIHEGSSRLSNAVTLPFSK